MNIDFHSHIIPNIDDGSDSIETSIAMLNELKKQGVDFVVATPHYLPMGGSVESFIRARNSAFDELKPYLAEATSPQIILGAEVAYTFEIEKLKDLNFLCLGGGKTLLLEMPMAKWSMEEINSISSIIYDRGLTVVIAHFERYFLLQDDDILKRLFKLPVYLQINAHSLCVLARRKKILKLFEIGASQLLGSDTHNMTSRPPHIEGARNIILKKLGQSKLDEIDETAQKILNL